MKNLKTWVLFGLCAPFALCAQDSLKSNFQSPPNEARPRVWWHWMNGNITQEGIRKDLEWMQRTGIGGFQNFDASLFTPVLVEKKLVFMTPEWKEAFHFATDLAHEKGLEMAIAGSPGWSVTGGPWVPARDGMKKYVWTETRLAGGQHFTGKLPQPAAATGNFQDVTLAISAITHEEVAGMPSFYADAYVIACKLPDGEPTLANLNPKVTSSGGSFSLNELTDGNLNHTDFLPPMKPGDDMWIQYEFSQPQTFKAASVTGASHDGMEAFNGGPLNRSLQVSDDGVNFREIASFTGSISPQNTVAFAAVSARFWRMAWKTLPPPFNPWAALAGGNPQAATPDGINVAEFVLHPSDRIDQFEDKAGFTPWKEDNVSFFRAEGDALSARDVVNLTDNMNADGTLDWVVPAGNWVILRFGYSLTGRQNHPASPEATGLEVDKLDADAVRTYINTYLDMYADATGGQLGAEGLGFMVLDSYEAGHMTWTHRFPEEFAKRRGYALDSWVPVLTGRVVNSREASEQFLWDFRKTIGELIVENHYEVIGEELHKRGMKRYTESHEDRRIYLADGMDVKRKADIPMAAMWTPGSPESKEEVRSEADIRESAAVAHIYGKKYVAGESMTSIQNAFTFTPQKLKRTADLEMASGLNRFVIHTSVHQPLDDKMPGFSLGPFGQYFTRQETWAEQARPWIDYLARSCEMLQQGRHVADVLVYYGENTNLTWRYREGLPKFAGYEYDFANSTALIEAVKAENGKLVTPGGAIYSVLFLDESARLMTLPVLKKLRDLSNAGILLTGTLPEKSPSLSDDPTEYQEVLAEIKVSGASVNEGLAGKGMQADVLISGNDAVIRYVHRAAPDLDIYWLDSRSSGANQVNISFRVTGRTPELWYPETGKSAPVSYKTENGRTVVDLQFNPWEAVFVVFRNKTTLAQLALPEMQISELFSIAGPWQVSFQPNRGAPASATFESLTSWSEQSDPGVKYFSGTATYSNSFPLKKQKSGTRILLDLGEVHDLAEVVVNGQSLGILWKTPFQLDISEAVKKGNNSLEIWVTNTWVNRLIGDAQPGVTEKITFTTMPFYQATNALLPAGLTGKVRLIQSQPAGKP